MLTSKELMQLEDVLTMEESCTKVCSQFANMTQDSQAKQVLQQLAQKNQQHFQTLKKHLNAGQTLQ
jgi:rubrerythrin